MHVNVLLILVELHSLVVCCRLGLADSANTTPLHFPWIFNYQPAPPLSLTKSLTFTAKNCSVLQLLPSAANPGYLRIPTSSIHLHTTSLRHFQLVVDAVSVRIIVPRL